MTIFITDAEDFDPSEVDAELDLDHEAWIAKMLA